MGLFSKKKKIIVSSVTYNLAGDIKDRVKFLPTAVAGHIMSKPASASLADTIVGSLLGGPGIRFRNFGKWAKDSGFNSLMEISTGSIAVGGRVNQAALLAEIPVGPNQSVDLQSAEVGAADYGFWADQYMANNHPTEIEDDYEIDMDDSTRTIYLRFASGKVYQFQPVSFDVEKRYLYASYMIKTGASKEAIVPGQTYQLGNQANWPDVSDWTYESGSSVPNSMVLTQTTTQTVTYSDGRPGTSTTNSSPQTVNFEDTDYLWFKDEYIGQGTGSKDQVSSTRQYQQNTTRSVKVSQTYTDVQTYDDGTGTGNTVTYTTTTTGEYRDFSFSYTTSTQKVNNITWSPLVVLIYPEGSGRPGLDALFDVGVQQAEYFPSIPIRVNNRFFQDGDQWKASINKALKKSMDTTYKKLQTALEANDSLKDIDNAYVLFGVSMNTKEPAARKYLFKFFDYVLNAGVGGTAALNDWEKRWAKANVSRLIWVNWKQAQNDPANPLFGTVEPQVLLYPAAPVNSLTIQSALTGFFINVEWTGVSRIKGVGLAKPDANAGDCWITHGATQDYTELMYTSGIVGERPASSGFITITWQLTATTYESIGVWGLAYTNIVYRGKGVNVSIDQAMTDTDESSFLIPINAAIYKALSLPVATQMSTSMGYMILNCYDVVKQKWYQTSWFKVILIIIVIVITVVTAGAGSGSVGLLGAAGAVGASLGFAGVMAIVVGTIANALAAMLLMKIIQMGATALFGEKVGAIVGAIAGVIAVSAGSAYMGGQGMAGMYSSLSSAQGLMQLTSAVGDGIAGYMKAAAAETMAATQSLVDSYEEQSGKIEKLYEQNIGYGITYLDAMSLTDATVAGGEKDQGQSEFVPEGPDSFFARTLMTGTDIAQMQHSMLTDFASLTVSTNLT
uniref:Membrane protein n=1 Tax=Pseudomonas phage Arace01 TaxID=3138526 RepID=A0AAU6VZU8_9VIRU